jgi:protein-S-isoprenylcysteine O-methyltransferase Ste14
MGAVQVVGALTLGCFTLAGYTIWRVERDFKRQGRILPSTTVFIYSVYPCHLALVVYSARRSLWALPLDIGVTVVIGVVLILVGLWLFLAGAGRFRSFEQVSGTETGGLITSGVYRWSRNPQYVGWGLLLFGVAVLGRSALGLLLAGLFWPGIHLYLISVEEPHLAAVFGTPYQRYFNNTPRYLGAPKRP